MGRNKHVWRRNWFGRDVDLFKCVDLEIWSDVPMSVLEEAEAGGPRPGRAEAAEAGGDCGWRFGPSRR